MEIFISSWQHVLTVMFISMLPIVEVKGSIPFGVFTLGMPLVEVFIIAIIGSCVPAPIVLFYIKKIIHKMQNSSVKVFNKASNFLMSKVEKHSAKVHKWGYLAIFIFVALPIPGTGVWTGSLLAAMMDLRVKYALPVIVAGNIVASLCMIFLTHSIKVAL